MKFKSLLHGLALGAALLSTMTAPAQSLIETQTVWRYLDDGSDQGTAWRSAGFDDSGWSNGVASFGVDTPGIWPLAFRTSMPVGGGRVTYYFRTHFNWSGSTAGASLIASNLIDDGAVFYLNGAEAGRVRITNNPVFFDSLALNQSLEGSVDVVTLATSNLVSGDNIIAVEVHQFTTTSSDVVFGMTLERPSPPGYVQFNNRIPPTVVAPIYGTNSGDPTLALNGNATTNGGSTTYTGPLLAGPGYTCELWAGPLGTPPAALTPHSSVPFRTTSGSGFIVAPPAVAVAGVPAGELATVQVRAWDNKGGTVSNWAGALADPTVARGTSASFTAGPLGTNSASAPRLTNLLSFNIHLPPAPLSYTIAIHTGFNLIANQLDRGSNTLNEIMPVVPPGTRLIKFDNATQIYSQSTFDPDDLVWIPANITLNPGEGAYLESPSNFSLTISGQPHDPVLPVNIPPGQCYLLSRQTNAPATYDDIVGLPPAAGDRVLRFSGGYTTYSFDPDDLVWTPTVPTANVGEALWVCPPAATFTPPTAPAITQQPTSQTVPEGQAATFAVAVIGSEPLSYHWRSFITNSANLPPPGIVPVLTISNAQPANAGTYFVVVSNAFGVVTSAVAVLNVSPALVPCCAGPCPNLVVNGSFEQTSPSMAPNQFHFFGPPTDAPGIVPGWSTTPMNSRQEIEIWCNNAGFPASDGTNHLEINAQLHEQTVFQVVTGLTPGYPATLCFNYTGRYGVVGGSYNNNFDLILSGGFSSTTPLNPPAYSTGGWQFHTTTFVPSGTSVTIAFHGQPHYNDGTSDTHGGAHIDRVCLKQETPAPTLVCAPDKTVECGSTWFFDPPTATGVGLIFSIQPPSVQGGPCSQTNTAVFVATDSCGRTVTCTQTVVVVDTTPPVMFCTDLGVPCGTAWTFIPPFAYDPVCSNTVSVTAISTRTNADSTCPVLVERAWRATDACGNSSICTQHVAIVDFTPPVFTGQCTTNHYEAGNTTDNFGGAQPTSPSPGLVARLQSLGAVFKGFDNCTTEHFVAHTFTNLPPCITAATVTVRLKTCGTILCGNDTFGFSFTGPNGQLAPGSGSWSKTIGSLVSDDWCAHTSGDTFVFDLSTLPAGGGATDLIASMNQNGFLDVICQDDTDVDYITLDIVSCCCGTNRTVECGTAWDFVTPTATDACCTNDVTVTALSTVTNVLSDCRQTITRVWQASDCCSNTAVCVEVVNVVDTTPPVLTGTCVTNIFQPTAAWPSTGVVARLAAGGVTCLKDFNDCTLDCFFSHTFDNLPASITSAKLTVRLRPCGGLGWTDTLGLYFTDANGTALPGGWSRLIGTGFGGPSDLLPNDWDTYTSGHTFIFDLANMPLGGANLLPYLNQHGFVDFIVQDDTAVESISLEVVSCGCDSTRIVECGTPWSFEQPTAFDACAGTNVTLSSVVFGSGNACSNVNTMIWTATDCCSNSISCTQRVVVVDTTAPVVTCPANKTVECGSGWTFDRPTAYDACSGTNVTIIPILPPLPAQGSCPWTNIQDWVVTDGCGNSAFCRQTVIVVDTTRPVLHCPQIVKVATCSNSVPVYYHVTATDNCDASVQIVCVPPSPGPFPLGTTVITCTATDDCGNSNSCSFPVVVAPGANFWQFFPAGTPDCYASPNERAARGSCLNMAYPGALWKQFDDPTVNRFFGHTWNLPNGIYQDGWLVTRMKDFNCQGISQNDTLSLGLLNCSPATWGWTRHLGPDGADPGLQPASWCGISNCNHLFNLHLSALPAFPSGTTTVLPLINSSFPRRLDMFVQDDTRVDFANLWLRRCPPQHIIGGLGVTLTNAQLAYGPGTWTLVKAPASTNGFSASFDLGAADGVRLNFDGLTFAGATGGTIRVSSAISDDTGTNLGPQPVWSLVANTNGTVSLLLDQSLPGVSNVIVLTLSNGVLVASNTLPATAGVELAGFPSSSAVRSISVGKGGEVTFFVWDNWERAFIMRFQPAFPDFAARSLASFTVTAEGFEQITLGQSEIGVARIVDPADGQHDDIVDPADGQHDDWFTAISGDALARAEGGQITVSALDATQPGLMGVMLSPCCPDENTNGDVGPREFRVRIDTSFGQFSPVPSNASLRFQPAFPNVIVDPEGGQHDDWVSVNFDHQGSSGWRITTGQKAGPPRPFSTQVLNNGTNVITVSNPTNVSVSELPGVYWASTSWGGGSNICHRFPYGSAITVRVNGTDYQATEVAMGVDTPSHPTNFTGLRIETVGAEALVLTGFETGPVRYQLESPIIVGSDIVIRANTLGGVIECSPSLTGPWTIVPAEAGEVRVSTTNAPAKFFRVRGN